MLRRRGKRLLAQRQYETEDLCARLRNATRAARLRANRETPDAREYASTTVRGADAPQPYSLRTSLHLWHATRWPSSASSHAGTRSRHTS
jgi:hypothetical protein